MRWFSIFYRNARYFLQCSMARKNGGMPVLQYANEPMPR
jgi:hypothetical protein